MMRIATREDLRRLEPRTELVPVPELGDDIAVRVRGYTLGERAAIVMAANPVAGSGAGRYDIGTDQKLSLITCIVEPKLNLADDGEWIDSWPVQVVDRILAVAQRLSGAAPGAYEQMREYLRANPYLQRLFVACQRLYRRLPSELDHVSEEEFLLALTALEMQAEQEAEAAG